jgi:hypothetical protein
LNEAKEALEVRRDDRRQDKLPTPGRKPNFLDYSATYLNKATVQRKRPGTLQNEQQAIARWRSHLGHVRIDKIATPMVASFVDKRLKGGLFGKRKLEAVSERTAKEQYLEPERYAAASHPDWQALQPHSLIHRA